MKKQVKKILVPGMKMNSEYFKCPRCGWTYPGPMLVKGDVAASTKCEKCGHSYLVRIK